MMKGSWVEIRTGRDHSPTTNLSGAKQTWLREISLIYHQSNQSRIIRKKTKPWNTFPQPLPSFQAKLHSWFSLPPSPEQHTGMGNGGCGQFITLCLCYSFLLSGKTPHTLPLLQKGVPPTGDSPSPSSPMWVLPMGCSPSGTDCFSVGPPGGSQALAANLLQCGVLFPCGHRSCQETAPVWAPHRVTPPSDIHLLWRGILRGLQVDVCSTINLHGLKGDSLPHHSLLHRLQGNLCSGTWSTSSPYFFTDLGVCRVLTPLSGCKCHYTGVFSSLILSQRCYHHHWWAWLWPVLGPSWSQLELALLDVEETSSSCLQKPLLQHTPPPEKLCHVNPVKWGY